MHECATVLHRKWIRRGDDARHSVLSGLDQSGLEISRALHWQRQQADADGLGGRFYLTDVVGDETHWTGNHSKPGCGRQSVLEQFNIFSAGARARDSSGL